MNKALISKACKNLIAIILAEINVLKQSYKIILPTLIFICFVFSQSCTPQVGSRVSNGNKNFEKKYGDQIRKFNKDRQEESDDNQNSTGFKIPEGQGMLNQIENTENNFPYQEIVKFGESRKFQKFFPDSETYEQATKNGENARLSRDIFELTYDTRLNPPFKRIEQEFDRIQIPYVDVYGISSSSFEKPYLLASASSIQKAVSVIKSQRANESKDQVKQKQMIDEINLASLVEASDQEKDSIQKVLESTKIQPHQSSKKLTSLKKRRIAKPALKAKCNCKNR